MWSARIRSLLAVREADDAPAPLFEAAFDAAERLDADALEALSRLGDTVDLIAVVQ